MKFDFDGAEFRRDPTKRDGEGGLTATTFGVKQETGIEPEQAISRSRFLAGNGPNLSCNKLVFKIRYN